MKGCILLIICTITIASAQTQNPPDSIASRLVALDIFSKDEDVKPLNDSIIYTHTGAHGGDLEHTIKFTREDDISFEPGDKVNDTLHKILLQTFNAHDDIDTIKKFTSYNWGRSKEIENRQLLQYDLNSNDTTILTQYEYASVWKTRSKEVNRYDSKNNKLSTVATSWDFIDGNWVPGEKRLTVYDTCHNTTSIHNYDWRHSRWDSTNETIIINTYNSTHERTAETEIAYTFKTGVMDTLSLATYLYNAGHKLVETKFYMWESKEHKWYIQTTRKCSYDDNNNITNIIIYSPDSLNYIYYTKEAFTYNNFNQLTSDIEKEYDNNNVMIGLVQRHYYYQMYKLKRK